MRFGNDLHFLQLHTADNCETEVLDEQLADLLIRKLGSGKIKPESFGSEAATVHELNVGAKVGAVLGHRWGV